MVNGMEDMYENANTGIADQEESTGSIPHPLFLGTTTNKRLRSKVWSDFITTLVDGKVTRAECMHCHQVFNCSSSYGTSNLLKHQHNCIPGGQKRPKQQEHTSLPSTQKSIAAASSDAKQNKLPFLPSSQKKSPSTTEVVPKQEELFLLGTHTERNSKNHVVGQTGSYEELAAPGQKNLVMPGISADKNKSHGTVAAHEPKNLYVPGRSTDKNKTHGKLAAPEQKDIPTGTSMKDQGVDQNCSPEELVSRLAMHGQLPRIIEQDRFRKLFAWLNPMVKMPPLFNLIIKTDNLYDQEKSRLKESLTALRCRVCLSAYMWHYDPHLAFLCLTVHYIDDEWKKQQKIIMFNSVNPSCNADELSNSILRAIREWGLDSKVFSIILDNAFTDESVASNVKANLQKWNKVAANRSLFVVRHATHLLDQVIQVGLDELDKFMQKSATCSKYAMSPSPSVVQYPNCRFAPSRENWITAKKICKILEHFHGYMDSMLKYPSPVDFFDKLRDVKDEMHCKANSYRQAGSAKRYDGFSKVLYKMQQKFKECWKLSFFHFCMPMVMNPKYRLERIKSRMKLHSSEVSYLHGTLLSLFNEYSNEVEDDNSPSGSKISKETPVYGYRDTLEYLNTQYPHGERSLTELDQYLQDPSLAIGESSVFKWWKEHSLTYPTISQMARDILALPCNTECKAAIRTARLVMSESGNTSWIESLVCTEDWLAPTGTANVESD
ncbi:hypothetical protein ACP4OV_024081 [Aristida adscensionis]